MAKYSMEDCKENNLFEEAKERYETTSPRWKKSWWQVICDIWTRAGDWHEKYELDKIAKVIINKIKDVVNQAKQVVTRTGINIIERVATTFETGTKLCYLFKFYDSNGDLIFSKVGTTERTIRQRLTEEIKYYRKRGIDVNYAIQMGQDVRLLKICNFCNKAFIAKNPKAEYDTYNCKNKANVYKSRAKSSNMVHTDIGIAVKLPSDDISEDLVKNINNRNCFDFIVF